MSRCIRFLLCLTVFLLPPLYLREKCRQDIINQKWETFSNSEAEGTAGGRPIYRGKGKRCVRAHVWEMCVCIFERAIKGRGDRHCGRVKLSAASLMETRHALNMNPSLSLFFLLKVLSLSWPLPSLCPLTSVPLKYLRWTRWCVCVCVCRVMGWAVMERLKKAFKAERSMFVCVRWTF